MKKENRRNILFRYGFIVLMILIVSARITYKLIDNTIVSADKWNQKAMEELSRIDTIPPVRGNILAADGSILATNLRIYTPRIDFRCPKFDEKAYRAAIDSIADSMAVYFPQRNAEQWRAHLEKPLAKPADSRSRSYPIIRGISHEESRLLRTFPFFNRKRRYTGLNVESKLARVRPYGAMARRSIGAVGMTKKSSCIHGIYGLEKALDSLLYGKPGVAKKVPLTKAIVNWTDISPLNGYNVRTTIDIKMQDIVENELNKVLEYCDADWGVAVLMDVASGDIKAISNLEKSPVPGEGFIESMNRAVLGFEPGSVVKTISMMIALEDGIVNNINEVITTGRSYAYAGGKPITDSHGVGSMPVREVIERSSNIGMTKIITRKYGDNPGAFYSRLKSIGFLDPMRTGIAGELLPRIDSLPNNKTGRIALSRQCYGYATEIPPIYTLSIYNAIANGGRYVRPRLVCGLEGNGVDTTYNVSYIRDRICSEANAAKMRTMLKAVVWGDHGTARRLRSDKVEIAGKTGTAYMIEDRKYNLSKKRLAFCGFFPADKPKYSCIVLTSNPKENARGAASTSGEVLKNIAESLYSRGMLDNSSDYRQSTAEVQGKHPTLYAAMDGSRNDKVQQRLGLGASKSTLAHPLHVKSGVPDVKGLGLRDALCRLENAGYNVQFHGAGYVCGQHPVAGTPLKRGQKVTLTLRE